jgi:hypothetical protein
MVRLFEFVRGELSGHQTKRVLVDLREGSVALTISDMLGLAKMVATTYAGVLERLALLLRPQDVLDEKFFEPSVSSRGLPTFGDHGCRGSSLLDRAHAARRPSLENQTADGSGRLR